MGVINISDSAPILQIRFSCAICIWTYQRFSNKHLNQY